MLVMMGSNDEKVALRDQLQEQFGWKFTYVSENREEARCIIPLPSDNTHLVDWYVKKLPLSTSSTTRTSTSTSLNLLDAKLKIHNQSKAPNKRKGLETQLEIDLSFEKYSQYTKKCIIEANPVITKENEPFNRSPRNNKRSLDEENKHKEQTIPSTRSILECLYSEIPIVDVSMTTVQDPIEIFLKSQQANSLCANLSVLQGICKNSKGEEFAIFQYQMHSLQDVLKFNRHVLHEDINKQQGVNLTVFELKKRFLVYQLLQLLHFIHEKQLAVPNLTASTLLLTDHLWIQLGVLPSDPRQEIESKSIEQIPREIICSKSITERWCDGDISNFEYLMIINAAAGRKMVDGVFHPFLPWVTDFSIRNGGWRDLTKSKFRLNKGDHQLDRTYQSSLIPHHITESLSEITYYIYMARRTPMPLLRQIVRSNFQPKEYPSSMQRMFSWTPDECIPEFYTDPNVFFSLHGEEVMESLQLPGWCHGAVTPWEAAVEFIRAHREMLESEQVSKYLHKWVDLNFGVCLSGEEAAKNKNIPLKVAADTTLIKTSGFVQLFFFPHPPRKLSTTMPVQAPISMPMMKRNASSTQPKTSSVGPSGALMASRSSLDGAAANASCYRTKESRRMLTQALSIANDAYEMSFSSGSDQTTSMSQIGHRIGHAASTSGISGGTATIGSFAEARLNLSSSKPKYLKGKKTKSRPRSQGSESSVIGSSVSVFPTSPTATVPNAPPSKAPSVSVTRIATAIPKFFNSSDNSHHHGSNSSSSSHSFVQSHSIRPVFLEESSASGMSNNVSRNATSGEFRSHAASVPGLTSTVSSSSSSSGTSAGTGGTTGGSGSHGHNVSLGNVSSNTSSNISSFSSSGHIFRDFWQNFSKSEEENAPNQTSETMLDGMGLSLSISQHNVDFDWSESDYEYLDDVGLQLLSLGLDIKLPPLQELKDQSSSDKDPSVNCSNKENELEKKMIFGQRYEALLDPAYSIPTDLIQELDEVKQMSTLELAYAADMFAFGCIIVEIYTTRPLFSKRSIAKYVEKYLATYRLSQNKAALSNHVDNFFVSFQEKHSNPNSNSSKDCSVSSGIYSWNADIKAVLDILPIDIQTTVLAMIHPNPHFRLSLNDLAKGLYVVEEENFKPIEKGELQTMTEEYVPSKTNLFPQEFKVLYHYLSTFHAAKNWSKRLQATKTFLPALVKLPRALFRTVLPVLRSFFQPLTHTTTISLDNVTQAVVYLLPSLMTKLEVPVSQRLLLGDVLRLYESNDLNFLHKLCLVAPDILKSLARGFGSQKFLTHFNPILVEWLASFPDIIKMNTSGDSVETNLAFATEFFGLSALSMGELSSVEALGPSLASKYLLPALLPHLGKAKAKWQKLTSTESSIINNASLTSDPSTVMHVTFINKTVLNEPHYLTDAVLLMCQEISEHAIANILIPHLFDVLPKLIVLGEKIGASHIDGIPEELAKEINVLFRILHHIVRNVSEGCVSREILNRKKKSLQNLSGMSIANTSTSIMAGTHGSSVSGSSSSSGNYSSVSFSSASNLNEVFSLMDLLTFVSPPFIHPRKLSNLKNLEAVSKTKLVSSMKKEHEKELSGFLPIGMARVIISVCQKLGPELILASPHVISGVNRFLTQCSEVYSQLEVTNFQWPLASEIVSEFCIPLRVLLGKGAFEKYFPIVNTSSVLQRLLLPMQDVQMDEEVNHLSPQLTISKDIATNFSTPKESSSTITTAKKKRLQDFSSLLIDHQQLFPKLLVQYAYRIVFIHQLKSTMFPLASNRSIANDLGLNQDELNIEKLRIHDERKKRKPMTPNLIYDSVWLRPCVQKLFTCSPSGASNVGSGGNGGSGVATGATSTTGSSSATAAVFVTGGTGSRTGSGANGSMTHLDGSIGTSWALQGEIRSSFKAHSSSIRSICVDFEENFVLTGSKNGSCRAWRLSSHPCTAQAAIYADSPILCVKNAMNGRHALASELSCVHLWDIRTGQSFCRLPFKDDLVSSISVLRPSPTLWYDAMNSSSSGSSSSSTTSSSSASASSSSTGEYSNDAHFAIATTKKIYRIDLRTGTKIVSDWRIDTKETTNISATCSVFLTSLCNGTLHSNAFLAIGTFSGTIVLLDLKMGTQINKWQAFDSPTRIMTIQQYSASQILVVGSEKEARVWSLNQLTLPRLRMVISGLPEGLRESQITIQSYLDTSVLYVCFSYKIGALRLIGELDTIISTTTAATDFIHTKLELNSMVETFSINTSKVNKSRIPLQAIGILPLRQLILLGTEDGCMKTVI